MRSFFRHHSTTHKSVKLINYSMFHMNTTGIASVRKRLGVWISLKPEKVFTITAIIHNVSNWTITIYSVFCFTDSPNYRGKIAFVIYLFIWVVCIFFLLTVENTVKPNSLSNSTREIEGPLKVFNDLVETGKLKLDLFQQRVISEHFQRLYKDLQNYKPPAGGSLLKNVSFVIVTIFYFI